MRLAHRSRVPAFGISLLLLVCFATRSFSQGRPEDYPNILLSEHWAIRLPDSLIVADAIILSSSAVAVLAAELGRAYEIRTDARTSIRTLCADVAYSGVAVARLASDGRAAVLDKSRRIVAIDQGAERECEVHQLGVEAGDMVLSAVGAGDGWLLIVATRSGVVWFVRLSARGDKVWRRRLSSLAISGVEAPRLFASAAASAVVLSSMDWPFGWRAVNLDATEHILRSRLAIDEFKQFESGWLGLRTVPLDVGYLQVLAQQSRPGRAFALYDASGELRRVSRVDAVLGVVTADANARLLLMQRRERGAELVMYSWAWSDP